MEQFHFDPETYLALMRAEMPLFDEFQDAVAGATVGVEARTLLELGTGTGETARRVLALHPDARLTGVDSSEAMLAEAKRSLDPGRVDALIARGLEGPLPERPFDVVFSALAVHHLDAEQKALLFKRVAAVLRPGGRFVLGDLVVPERPEDVVTPATPGFDLPDTTPDLLLWLEAAGLQAQVVWEWKDLAILVAERPSVVPRTGTES